MPMFWGSGKPLTDRKWLSDLNAESRKSTYILSEIGEDIVGFASPFIAL